MTETSHHVGFSTPLRLKNDITSTAIYGGENNCYRYTLKRVWDSSRPLILWIMMNPSVATEVGDDRTVAKCQRYARAWGYGGIYVGNSFAYRCTDQKRLLEVEDPIGPENNHYLLEMARHANKIILAYGTPQAKTLHQRGTDVAHLLQKTGHPITVLRLSRKGKRPEHPLYLPAALTPLPLNANDLT